MTNVIKLSGEDFDAYDRQEDEERTRAASSLLPVLAPDQLGRAEEIATERGLPTVVVADHFDEYQQRDRADKVAGAAGSDRDLGSWLSDPIQQGLAADDLPSLQRVSKAAAPWYERSAAQDLNLPRSQLDVARSMVRQEQAQAKAAAEWQRKVAEDPAGVADALRAFGAAEWQGVGMAVYGVGSAWQLAYNKLVGEPLGILGAGDQTAGNPMAELARAVSGVGDRQKEKTSAGYQQLQRDNVVGGDLFKPATWTLGKDPSVVGFLTNGIDVMGQLAPMIVATIASGGSAGVGFGLGAAQGGGAAAQQVGDGLQAMYDQGTLAKESTVYRDLLASGLSETAALTETKRRGEQWAFSLAAPIAGAGGALTTKLLTPATSVLVGRSVATQAGGRAGLSALEEGAQETLEGIAANVGSNEGAGTSIDVTEGSFGNAVLGALGGAGPGAVAGAVAGVQDETAASSALRASLSKWQRANRSAEDKASLDVLMKEALDSKVRARAPGKFEALVKAKVGEATVYVPTASLEMLYQDGDAAAEVAKLTGSDTAWTEALAAGTAVPIPMSVYVSRLAEAHAQIGGDVRTAADLDALEPAEYLTPEQMRADFEAAMAEGSVVDDEAARGGAVFQDVYGQLISSGIPDSTAAQQALAMQQVFRTWETRFGLEPDTLAKRYQFNINRPQQVGGKARDVDAFLDPVIEQVRSNRARGKTADLGLDVPTLASLVIKGGGINPESIGAGDLKGIKRPGLFNASGMTVEAMAQALAEDPAYADLFTTKDEFGRPDYRELLEMLADEEGGTRTFRPALEGSDAAAAENMARVDEVTAIIDQLEGQGVEVDTIPVAELRAMVEAILNEQAMLEQPAFHGTHARDIDRFSLQKIGTGEGAQIYGWGLYFASNRKIAEWYRETVSQKHASTTIEMRDPYVAGAMLTMDVGSGEFGGWLAGQFDAGDSDLAFEVLIDAAAAIERYIDTRGDIPVPAWVDTAVLRGDIRREEAPDALRMIALLREHGARADNSASKPFVMPSPDGGQDRWDAYDIQGLFVDADEFGHLDDQVVEDAASLVVDVLRAPDKQAAIAALSIHSEVKAAVTEMVAQAEKWGIRYDLKTGQVYQVDVPEDSDLLDYDKPLRDQPEAVIAALEPYIAEAAARRRAETSRRMNSQEARESVMRDLGKDALRQMQQSQGSPRAASEYLFSLGIPGLRYLDGSSRNAGEGTHNYVIWDEAAISEPQALFQQDQSQTDTPEFRKWFGESEVMEDGQPKVVYHGSQASFDSFDPDEHTAGWFSEATATADKYADNPNRFDPEATTGPSVYPVFLSIQNPAHLPFDMNDSIEAVWETAREIGIENPEAIWRKPMPGVHKQAWSAVRSDKFMDALRAYGFDGIRVKEKGVWTWAAFEPTQIKSATGNSGAFDPDNPSILFQSDQPLVSALAAAVDLAKGAPKKGDAAAWKGWMDGAQRRGEFKQAERDYMKLDEWLDEIARLAGKDPMRDAYAPGELEALRQFPGGKVTREQLQDFVRANQLQVTETLKGAPVLTPGASGATVPINDAVVEARQWLNARGYSLSSDRVYRWSNEIEFDNMPGEAQAALAVLAAEAEANGEDVDNVGFDGGNSLGPADRPWLDDLPFTVTEVGTDRGAGNEFEVIGPRMSMGYFTTRDEAEVAAFEFSGGFLRNAPGGQRIQLPEIGRDFMVARVTQEDVDDFGLDDDQLGTWGMFEADRPQGDPVKGEFIGELNLPEGASYARAMERSAQVLLDMDRDEAEGSAATMGGFVVGSESRARADGPWSSMVLPGGKNYRVMLVQLPSPMATLEARRDALVLEAGDIRTRNNMTPDTPFESLPEPDRSRIPEIRQLIAVIRDQLDSHSTPKDFSSSHFGESNIVAHVRFDERVDADGKRVLMIQELQSDWHQQGRKQGYKLSPDERRAKQLELAQARNAVLAEIDSIGGFGFLADEPEIEQRYIASDLALRQLHENKGVPDAPFKTTWPDLVLRRMVRFAAENGFDRVAWPTRDMVPLIEKWPWTAAEIDADPDMSKKYGAILDRYSVELPRLAKTLTKKFGGELVTSNLTMPGIDANSVPPNERMEPQDPNEADYEGDLFPVAWAPAFRPMTATERGVYDEAAPFANGDAPVIGEARMTADAHSMRAEFVVSADYIELHPLDWESFRVSWEALEDADLMGIRGPPATAAAGQAFASDLLRDPDFWIEAGRIAGTTVALAEPETGGIAGWETADSGPSFINATPAIEITEQLREAALAGLPLFQGQGDSAPRGGITGNEGRSIIGDSPGPDGRRVFNISLFAGMNYSTFLHENGHAFLEIMGDLSTAEGAPEQAVADWQKVLAFLGVTDRSQIGRAQHEKWARANEAYLREGVAPSPALRRAFAAFKVWLTQVYKMATQLNVELTDEVRGVFDRMYATDSEIAEARKEQGLGSMFRHGETVGMSPEQAQAYWNAVNAAEADAETVLAAEVLRAQQRAAKAFLSSERRKVRATVEATTRGLRPYRALRWLRSGLMPDGSEVPTRLKISRQSLLDAGYLPAFIKTHLSGTYAKNGGSDVALVADLLGYATGAEMVQELVSAPRLWDVINADTDRIMAERYPDPLVDGTLADRAMAAVHREKQAEAMLLGVQALERHVDGRVRSQGSVLARVARELIGAKTARDVQPNAYKLAEAKAGREAFAAAAKQDWPAAAAAARRQLLAHHMWTAARNARTQFEKDQKYLKKAASLKTRERVGKGAGKFYVDALDAIFEGIEVRSGVSRPEVARRASLREWVARMQDEGNDTAVSESLLARVESERVTNIEDMSLADVASLRESVENILHLARTKNEILTAKGKREFEEFKAEALAQMQALEARKDSGITLADRSMLERIKDLRDAAWNWVLQPETIVEWLDGGEAGLFHDVLQNLGDDAEAHRNRLKRQVRDKLQAALETLGKDERADLDQRRLIPSLNRAVSGHTILSALLNMGNTSSRDKLTRGGWVDGDNVVQFTDPQLFEMFGTLSKKQAESVQAIWDAIDSLWPEIVEQQEATAGFAPERLDPTPFTVMTKQGPVLLRGGYYPAVYDPAGGQPGQQSADEQAARLQSGQMPTKASTSKGYVEKRTEYAAPMLLDYHAVLSRHLDGVMSDLAYRRPLRQAYRILSDPDIRRAIDLRIGPNATKALIGSFERGAVGVVGLAPPMFGPWQKTVDAGLSNLSSAALGFRAILALANTITAPMLAAVRVSPKFQVVALATYYRDMKGNIEMIHGLSDLMRQRATARSWEFGAILENLRGKRGFRKQMIEMAMSVQQWTVPLAENFIWLGRYLQAQSEGAGIEEAVRLADKAIRQTQMKSATKDLSVAEGNQYLRAMMMFAGPLVIINNRLQESGLRGLRGDVKSVPQALGVWFAMAMGGAWMFELIMGRGPEDEDDDGDIDALEWTAWAAKKLALMPFAGYPLLREIAGYMDNGFTRPHPIVQAGAMVTDLGTRTLDTGEAIVAGEDIEAQKIAESLVRAAGVTYGVPSNQLIRTGRYAMEVGTGDHEPENPIKEAWYIMQGPPKD